MPTTIIITAEREHTEHEHSVRVFFNTTHTHNKHK